MAERAFWQFNNFKDILIEGGTTTNYVAKIETKTYSETHGRVIPIGVLPPPFNTEERDNCKYLRSFLVEEIHADVTVPSPVEMPPSFTTDAPLGQKYYNWNLSFTEPGYYLYRHIVRTSERLLGSAIYEPIGRAPTAVITAFIKSRIIAKVNGSRHVGATYVPVIGEWNTLDFSESRGDELLKQISVLKRSGSGPGALLFVTATPGVDYELETLGDAKWRIKFLDDLEFEVVYNIKGYNSNNHPYTPVSPIERRFYTDAKKVLTNEESLRIRFNSREREVIITYPKIIPNFISSDASLIISEDPYNVYVSTVLVKPQISYSTGVYLEEGDSLAVSEELWREMMISDLKLDLEVYNESDELVNVIEDANWDTGNYVELLTPGKFKVKYKTTTR